MSGGSMDYLYSRLQWQAEFIEDSPHRRAFRAHLALVAKALHDIEWVDSGDYGPGDEEASILACVGQAAIDAARGGEKRTSGQSCGSCRLADSWGLPNSVSWCRVHCRPTDDGKGTKYQPLNAARGGEKQG